MGIRRRLVTVLSLLALLAGVVAAISPVAAVADHTPEPASVTIAGDLQSELGCPGDWQPDCAGTHLGFDVEDSVWQGVFSLPAGNYQYKAALDDSWAENYGANGVADGPNIPLNLAAPTDVKFYYDHESHWVTDDVNSTIATVVGSFQSELGCSGDWQPWCLRSWMQDIDGDGTYAVTVSLPGDNYEAKVAHDEGWAENYGAGGAPDGTNIPFTVPAPSEDVTFTYDPVSHLLAIQVGEIVQPGSVTIAGDLQSELGCPGDWQPDCADTHLGFDVEDSVWQGVFSLPAGSYQYKAALDDSWAENYGANAVSDGPNIPLNLAAPTDVKFYYDHESHWVSDDVNSTIATVVGSFQSELGCSGDWQPWCLRSWMQDIDGDGIYTFATDRIPSGGHEFKVALNEDWAVSYPGSNVAFTATGGATVTFTYDSSTNDVSVDVGGGTSEPGDELLVRPVVREAAGDNVFYFVMPDRFDNGDPGNDSGGDVSGDPLVNGFDPTHKGFYHGGDLAGLTTRLPYLDGLGITAIWLTPQFTNRWVQGEGTPGGTSAGYHGYWQTDYSSIDPHFGTNAEMQAFVSAAHALGIDVYFDIVANHTGDVITYVEGDNPPYISKADSPYRDDAGVAFDDRDFAGTGTFPPLDPNVSFPYTPTFNTAADETVKSPAFLNDPTLYHNRGNSTFSGENSLYGDFFGLDDLWTEHPTVQDGMIQVFKDMVTDYDVDGFRIDTVKHVNDEFWEAFGPELRTHAASLGKDDFFMFGEVFDFDVRFLSRFSTELPLDATLDFAFQGTARNFAGQGGSTDNVANFYAAGDYYTDADSNAYQLPLFLGNHDMGRIGLFVNQDNPGASDAELVARDELAHALMYFGRGMPVIYYGDEQGFVGDGGDQDARQDMMPSAVPSYNDDDNIGTTATTADGNFDDTHPLYQTLADFGQLLTAHPTLTQGAQLQRYSEPSVGVLAFSRIERTERIEYVVALNNSESADTATFRTDSPNTTFTELWPGGGASINADGLGDVTVGIPALDFKLYRADATIPAPTLAPVVTMTAPTAGTELLGRVEIGAALSLPGYAEVTFAVAVDGAPYEPIGTDDNSPYRVFYDVSGLAPGTPLEFKAIADNMSGSISSDKVAAVVGEEEPPTGGGLDYAVIHYNRPSGDYGDHTTGDFNDFWGLHLWGDAIGSAEVTDWPVPKPFLGEDEFGRFAWIRRGGSDSQVNFIIHQGDTKDTPNDRFFDADVHPEIWINQGDATIYTSQADARGFATIRYHRDDGDYGTPSPDSNTFWGLHLWGDAIDPAEATGWLDPKPPTGIDDFGAFWEVLIDDSTQPLNYIIHRGDTKDPGPDESFIPAEIPTVWKISQYEAIYPSRGAAEDFATIHYHRDDGDYGDNSSPDFNDFWGLHVWDGALNPNPSWQDPVRWTDVDVFGPEFVVELDDAAPLLAYIIHRGDTKDPGPDQFLTFDPWGYEVWQLEGLDPSTPEEPHYVLPIVGVAAGPGSIDIEKLTNGNQADGAHDADVPQVAPGDPVIWTYVVTNTGTAVLDIADINVSDDVIGTITNIVDQGDGDNVLGPGEVWIYTADGTALDLENPSPGTVIVGGCNPDGTPVPGDRATYENIGTVTVPGDSDSDPSHYCNPPNNAPTADADGPYVISEGDSLTLDATGSSDADGDPLTFRWDVDGDGDFDENVTDPMPTLTWAQLAVLGIDDGPYLGTVAVEASDGALTSTASTTLTANNVAPAVTASPASVSAQYSDPIPTVTITATDVAADTLSASATLPDAGTITPGGLVLNDVGTGSWILSGIADLAPGAHIVTVTVVDDDTGSTSVDITINVTAEDADVAFDSGNAVAVEVASEGGDSGAFDLGVSLTDADDGYPGDIEQATLAVTLVPVGPGSPVAGNCAPDGGGDWTCSFSGVAVNTYTVLAEAGGFYTGTGEDVLVVFDPSLGFTTGGGTYTDAHGDRVNFGYTMKYNKKHRKVQGSLLVIRHSDDGLYRLKSNRISGLAIGSGDGFDWASFSGKATYGEPGEDAIGNYTFVAYVEDHATPGAGADRFWVSASRHGELADGLSMAPEATTNAVMLDGGNIVVPHQAGGRGRPH